MSQRSIAKSRYRSLNKISSSLVKAVRRLWRDNVDPDNLVSWRTQVPVAAAMFSTAQVAASRGSREYVSDLLVEYNEPDPFFEGHVNSGIFGLSASDGRDVFSLVEQPMYSALDSLRSGASPARAKASGQFVLEMIADTQVADAGRISDLVEQATKPTLTGYVRMIEPGACSRCVILAGMFYRFNQGFLRHPSCKCVHVPAPESTDDDVRTNPRAYFYSLSEEEQDRIFTKAGAEAIRLGADLGQVVNARRGMTKAGTTREGSTRRGLAGQRMKRAGVKGPRLMPETILTQAKGNREEAVRLLRVYGFIV